MTVSGTHDSVVVREATAADELGVRRVLDAAMLESTAASDAIARGDVLVAVAGGDGSAGGVEGGGGDGSAGGVEGGGGDESAGSFEGGAVDGGRVVGALVLVPHSAVELPDAIAGPGDGVAGDVGMHVDAVAVRRRRRGQGIGRALVVAALDRESRLTVAFDPGVRAFYDALEFTTVIESEETTDGRAWAVREQSASLGA